MNGVLVDREALADLLARTLRYARCDCCNWHHADQHAPDCPVPSLLSALALPAQAAADAAGVLKMLADWREAERERDAVVAAIGSGTISASAVAQAVTRKLDAEETLHALDPAALRALADALPSDAAGVHVISAERGPAGTTPGMVEAAQRIARSVVRSESFSLELGEGVTLPAGRLRLTAIKDGAGAFEFLPDVPLWSWTTER